MKKKLEGELISIAHRVLKLKNKSETVQLQQEAKNIYEQLTILRFYEENFETIKNDILPELFEEKLKQIATIDSVETIDLEEKVIEISQPIKNNTTIISTIKEEETVAKIIVEEEKTIETEEIKPSKVATTEDIDKVVAEMMDKKIENNPVQSQQTTFEDLLEHSYKEPEFVRVEDTLKEIEKAADLIFGKKEEPQVLNKEVVDQQKGDSIQILQTFEKQEVKPKSLNDKLTNAISFGLNDRIAFEKKLFGGSADDFNRVVSQLNTFDTFAEASSFIVGFVKPDYKNWEGQEEYETRFLEIIEKKFN